MRGMHLFCEVCKNLTVSSFPLWGEFSAELPLVFGKILEGERFLAVEIEFQEHEIQLPDLLEALLIVIDRIDQCAHIYDFVPFLQFRRDAACVFQKTVGHSQVFGNPGLILKNKRLPPSFEVIELAVEHCFGDPSFSDPEERLHIFLPYGEHSVQGPFCRYAHLFRYFNNITIFLQSPENTVQSGFFHSRTDHVFPQWIKYLIGVLFSQTV
jgi:hypothetical protein